MQATTTWRVRWATVSTKILTSAGSYVVAMKPKEKARTRGFYFSTSWPAKTAFGGDRSYYTKVKYSTRGKFHG